MGPSGTWRGSMGPGLGGSSHPKAFSKTLCSPMCSPSGKRSLSPQKWMNLRRFHCESDQEYNQSFLRHLTVAPWTLTMTRAIRPGFCQHLNFNGSPAREGNSTPPSSSRPKTHLSLLQIGCQRRSVPLSLRIHRFDPIHAITKNKSLAQFHLPYYRRH